MKKIISFILCVSLLITVFALPIFASDDESTETDSEEKIPVISEELENKVKSAVLMEAETGKILYAKNENDMLPPASVTKIMTLILVAEALDQGKISLEDKVSVSANAASMGGSQIFVKEGEEFTVEELVKCTVIASANDCAVALSELVAGSESAFVGLMNSKAKELGLKNTVFENCTGLDDSVQKHLTSARDIAVMSRELIKHDIILKYSNVWQDTVRNGQFVLTNTNRLVRYYDGCTGLKTGSTDKAGYCLSATAKRNGMHLISVVMGAESRDDRNTVAKALLDYGFANYALYHENEKFFENADLHFGKTPTVELYTREISFLIPKGKLKEIESVYEIPDFLNAPIEENTNIGKVIYKLGNEKIGICDIFVKENCEKIGVGLMIWNIFKSILTG